jgi:hypothetical protein
MMLTLRLGLCAALPLVLLVGCSSSRNPQAQAKVSGAVTYKGTPVPAGSITFHVEKGASYGVPLGEGGTYEVSDMPTGEMVITVETESVNPAKKAPDYGGGKGAKMYAERLAAEGKGMAAAKEPTREYRKIPLKYGKTQTSPLTFTVEAGRNVKNIDLTD